MGVDTMALTAAEVDHYMLYPPNKKSCHVSTIPTNFKTTIDDAHQWRRNIKPPLYLSDGTLQITFCQGFGKVDKRQGSQKHLEDIMGPT